MILCIVFDKLHVGWYSLPILNRLNPLSTFSVIYPLNYQGVDCKDRVYIASSESQDHWERI